MITVGILVVLIAALCYVVYDIIMFNRYVSGLEMENSDLKEEVNLEYNKEFDNENAKVSQGVENAS